MLIDYRLRLPLTRKILDDHVSTFHWAHAKNSPEKGLQGRLEIDERILLLRLQFRFVVGLYHSVIILIEMAQPLEKKTINEKSINVGLSRKKRKYKIVQKMFSNFRDSWNIHLN